MLTEKHTRQLAAFYLLCFLINYCWFWFNGLLFSTINPVFFLNRLDFTRNLLMLSNLQHLLPGSSKLRICFDLIYLLLPVLLSIAAIRNFRQKKIIAYCTIGFTIIYSLFFTSVSYIGMEGYISWILAPLILSAATLKGFYYYLHAVRILFILIMVSTAIAKIRSLAVFNIEQMSAILLYQHNLYLVSDDNDWFKKFIYFLVRQKMISYILYLMATLFELSFALGLFTRKYDRKFIAAFCLFLILDLFLMRINYFTWLIFMGCFYFSTFDLAKRE